MRAAEAAAKALPGIGLRSRRTKPRRDDAKSRRLFVDENHVHDVATVAQNHGSARQNHARIAARNRLEAAVEILWKRLHAALQAGRQASTAIQTLFEPRRKVAVAPGEAW